MATFHPITRRTFVAASIGALISLGLNGCDSSSLTASSSTKQTVSDSVGRQVEVPVNPARVAGLDSFTGELMVMIGAGPQLVGTPAGVVSDTLLQEIYPDLKSVPAPMTNGSVNIEELMNTDPEVVIIKQDLYETDGEMTQLDATGIPYVVVGYTTIEEQIAAMELVGQVCGGTYQDKADALADYYRQVVEECGKRVEGLADEDKVRVYHAIDALTMTDGADSLGGDWVATAGAIDVSAADKELATTTDYTTTLEQIYTWDPDVFVCNSANSTTYLTTKSNCKGLRAVKAGECYTIPVGATRWGQRGSVETYLAMLWLGVTIYPKLYKDVNLKKRVISYYKEYLGLEINDTTYERILSGEGVRIESTKSSNQ